MVIKATLKPGQNGTKRLKEKYGERLICVRYRYDEQSRRRYTTVELVEEQSDWAGDVAKPTTADNRDNGRLLGVRIGFNETSLRNSVKAKGAIWRPKHQLWEMRYDDIVALGLESRVVPGEKG